MAYCSKCGSEVGETARFCSNCAHPLSADSLPLPAPTDAVGASPEVREPSSAATHSPPARGLNDVPRWLGWLAIPITLTVIGIPIYCFWAYRRGRRDGVGRERTEQPTRGMGWMTFGWSLALLVPFLSWYAAVHLPTLWYKHGLRVGAKEGTASPRFTSLPAVFGAAVAPGLGALAALFLVIFLVSGGTSSGDDSGEYVPPANYVPISQPILTAAPIVPRLTGAEAAGKANNSLLESASIRGSNLSVHCAAEDHNDTTSKWIVLCVVAGPQKALELRAQVDDTTGSVKWPTLATPS